MPRATWGLVKHVFSRGFCGSDQIPLENRSWECFCLHFTLWGVLLGAPGCPWATLGAPLGDLGTLQGCPGSLLGLPRGSPGTLRGPTWDPPGLPGPPGVDLGGFWPPKTMKNQLILVAFRWCFRCWFCRFFALLCRVWFLANIAATLVFVG